MKIGKISRETWVGTTCTCTGQINSALTNWETDKFLKAEKIACQLAGSGECKLGDWKVAPYLWEVFKHSHLLNQIE